MITIKIINKELTEFDDILLENVWGTFDSSVYEKLFDFDTYEDVILRMEKNGKVIETTEEKIIEEIKKGLEIFEGYEDEWNELEGIDDNVVVNKGDIIPTIKNPRVTIDGYVMFIEWCPAIYSVDGGEDERLEDCYITLSVERHL